MALSQSPSTKWLPYPQQVPKIFFKPQHRPQTVHSSILKSQLRRKRFVSHLVTTVSFRLSFERFHRPTDSGSSFSAPRKGLLHYAPVFRLFKPLWRKLSGRPPRPRVFATTNVPLEISMFLSGYVAEIMRRKTVESTLIGPSFTALNQLSDA